MNQFHPGQHFILLNEPYLGFLGFAAQKPCCVNPVVTFLSIVFSINPNQRYMRYNTTPQCGSLPQHSGQNGGQIIYLRVTSPVL